MEGRLQGSRRLSEKYDRRGRAIDSAGVGGEIGWPIIMVEVDLVSDEKRLHNVFAIREQVFVQEQGVDPSVERDEFDKNGLHFLATWQGVPVGAGRLVVCGDRGKIGRLCVLREYRGQGIGQALMQAIERNARKLGLRTLYLHAQCHAIEFYSRLGYRPVGEEFWEAGIKHIEMEKHLSESA